MRENGSTISGIPLAFFAVAVAVVLVAVVVGELPGGMVGALAFLMASGGLLAFVGDRTPVLKDYLGGAPLVCIFGAAAMVYFGVLPEPVSVNVSMFMRSVGFLDFYIAALITGSILGMDAGLLKRAGLRYAFPLIGGVGISMVVTALLGAVLANGWRETLLFICFPIVGGGMGAGAVPMSEIVSSISGGIDASTALSRFVPALALGNVLCIVIAGLLDKLGKIRPALTGNGVLMRGFEAPCESARSHTVEDLGLGLFVACIFFVGGRILGHFIPVIHSYALMILSVGALKILNVVPDRIELAAEGWYRFVVANFTPALLVGIGIAYTDLEMVFQTMSLKFALLVVTAVVTIVIASGFIGTKVGFYFVESALTSGLGMADMGGTGDVAVLSAARRMELMPFMQISSRLGGALILVLVSLLAPLLLK